MTCLCLHPQTDHAGPDGPCWCGCPEFRPDSLNRGLVSDEDWAALLERYVDFHRPLMVKDGPHMEIHWVAELGEEP